MANFSAHQIDLDEHKKCVLHYAKYKMDVIMGTLNNSQPAHNNNQNSTEGQPGQENTNNQSQKIGLLKKPIRENGKNLASLELPRPKKDNLFPDGNTTFF